MIHSPHSNDLTLLYDLVLYLFLIHLLLVHLQMFPKVWYCAFISNSILNEPVTTFSIHLSGENIEMVHYSNQNMEYILHAELANINSFLLKKSNDGMYGNGYLLWSVILFVYNDTSCVYLILLYNKDYYSTECEEDSKSYKK